MFDLLERSDARNVLEKILSFTRSRCWAARPGGQHQSWERVKVEVFYDYNLRSKDPMQVRRYKDESMG